MTNHQGVGQHNSNESIQSEGENPESTEARGVGSSSSHTGSLQSSPNEPSFPPHQESLNIVQSNDHGAGVIHHNPHLNAEYVENGHHTNNQNASVGGSNLSDLMAGDSGRSCAVDEQGADNSLVNTSHLSPNRSPEHATVQVNTSNSSNIVAPHTGAANIHQQQFNSESGRGTTRPVSNMQQLNEARHGSANGSLFSIEAGIDHGITTRPFYVMPHLSHTMGHARNFGVIFPRQAPQYFQQDHPPLFIQAQASIGAIPYGQPFVPFPHHFRNMQLPVPWVNVMGPTSVAPPFSPFNIVPGGGSPHNNISRTAMLGSQTRMGGQLPYLTNSNFGHGSASFLGNFASPSHYGPFSDGHLLNAPTGVPWFHAPEQHMPTLLVVGSPSAVIGSAGFQGQLIIRALQRFDNQSSINFVPPFVDGTRNNLTSQVILRPPVPGLSEEYIMAHLRLEEFQSPAEATPESPESCCICQEEHADGEDIGVLDCSHKFHYECVKRWLRIKNTCPLCVSRGLAV